MLRLLLPSAGELAQPTQDFLRNCGIPVERENPRQYTATLLTLPMTAVLFQRHADIPEKVEEGSADLGITGLDTVRESWREGGSSVVLLEDLGYSRCALVVAVPDSWIDVSSMADLADLAADQREQGKDLRVATRYPRLTQQFFLRRGLNYFTLVESTGTLEVAPAMGYADIITDLTATGVTLRENNLKTLSDGTILSSQACLIGNRSLLAQDPEKLHLTKAILELMEGHLRAGHYYSVTANIQGASPEAVAEFLRQHTEVAGLQGPTIAPVYSRHPQEQGWFAVTVVARTQDLLAAVEHLRQSGGNGITISAPRYVFEEECRAYRALTEELVRAGILSPGEPLGIAAPSPQARDT